jgi:NAD(P)H-hydrate repair Nnr-like enzyme with NAD(P)H-hydrate dehydratase domain
MDRLYWLQQSSDKPLFSNIEWSKPEQKSHAGRLGIIGGNSLGFAGVAEAYQTALQSGVGYTRALLPASLKKNIPISMTDVLFGATNPSGSLARDAMTDMLALGEWASGILLIGDSGRNSETAILYEEFVQKYPGLLILTRDAIDLLRSSSNVIVDRPNTLLVMSFAQLQKLFQSVYYPKVLTFSMQLTNLVEILHKFTITYPATISVLHQNTMLVAHNGTVTSTPNDNPMAIWKGTTATRAAAYWIWNPGKPLESVTASLIN